MTRLTQEREDEIREAIRIEQFGTETFYKLAVVKGLISEIDALRDDKFAIAHTVIMIERDCAYLKAENEKLRSEMFRVGEDFMQIIEQKNHFKQRVQQLREAIKDSIARADDCADSYNSKPIREALKHDDTESESK